MLGEFLLYACAYLEDDEYLRLSEELFGNWNVDAFYDNATLVQDAIAGTYAFSGENQDGESCRLFMLHCALARAFQADVKGPRRNHFYYALRGE